MKKSDEPRAQIMVRMPQPDMDLIEWAAKLTFQSRNKFIAQAAIERARKVLGLVQPEEKT